MKKDKISRRDFLKLAITSIGAYLASCMPRATQTLTPTLTATSTNTNTSEPTFTNTPTSTPTETPIPTEIPCFHLLSPENGTKLNPIGKVTFAWEAMQGAISYKLEIIFPSAQSVFFETNNTSRDQYLEAFSMGGTYQWKVTAFDATGKIICFAESFAFEKPEYNPPPQNQNNGSGDDDGNGEGNGEGGGNTVGSPVVGTTIGSG